MKDLRDQKDWTIHDVKPISEEHGFDLGRAAQAAHGCGAVILFFHFIEEGSLFLASRCRCQAAAGSQVSSTYTRLLV